MNAHRSSVVELAQRPAGAFFYWEAPGAPMAVHFQLSIVDLLEGHALRGGDLGAVGVLLGRIDSGRRPTLIVEDCEPIQVPPLRGPYDSPFGDHDAWKSVMDRWHSLGKRISILGFYRSCAHGQAKLNEHDLAVLRSNPTKSEQIFLIIETEAGKPCRGVLFMARDGAERWRWDAVCFNRKELSGREPPPRPAQSTPQQSPLQLPDAAVAEAQEASQRINRDPTASSMLYWVLGFLTGVALITAGLLSFRSGRLFQLLSNMVVTKSESALGLRAERSGNDLQLSWDRDAPILRTATAGRLLIADGSIHKNLGLELSELQRGSILYSPITDDVVLRLEVLSAGSTTSESVRVVAGLLPPLPAESQFPSSEPTPPWPPKGANSAARPWAPRLADPRN